MSLGRTAILGAGASWVGALAGFGIRFALNAVLARLIAPAQFGQFALAFVYAELLGIIISATFAQAIVQFRDPADLTIAATLQLNAFVCTLLISAGLLLYPAVDHFDGSEVARLVLALSAARAATIMAGTYDAVLQREFRFGEMAVVRVGGILVTAAGSLVLALLKHPFAALFARDAAGPLASIVGMLFRVKVNWGEVFRPSAAVREIRGRVRRLGLSIFWVRGLEIAYQRLDQLLLGRLLGVQQLAFYYQARYTAGLPFAAVSNSTSSVALRVLAVVADEPAKLRRTLELLQVAMGHLAITCALVLAYAPRATVGLMFGVRWLACADILPLLFPWTVLMPLAQNTQLALMALERWDSLRRAQYIQMLVLVLVGPPAIFYYGQRGAALAIAAPVLASIIVMQFAMTKQQRPRRSVYRGMIAGVLLEIPLWMITKEFRAQNVTQELLASGLAILVYCVANVLVDRDSLTEISRYAWSRIRSDESKDSSTSPS